MAIAPIPQITSDPKTSACSELLDIYMMTNKITDQIDQERQNARQVCDVSGETSSECAAAWDAVEELQAEAAHQREHEPKSSFEKYCDDNPDAVECRVYDD